MFWYLNSLHLKSCFELLPRIIPNPLKFNNPSGGAWWCHSIIGSEIKAGLHLHLTTCSWCLNEKSRSLQFCNEKNTNFKLQNNIHLNQRVHMGLTTTTERIESGVPLLVSPFIHESFNSLLGVWQCLLSMHGPFGFRWHAPFLRRSVFACQPDRFSLICPAYVNAH